MYLSEALRKLRIAGEVDYLDFSCVKFLRKISTFFHQKSSSPLNSVLIGLLNSRYINVVVVTFKSDLQKFHVALLQGHLKDVKELIENGASVNDPLAVNSAYDIFAHVCRKQLCRRVMCWLNVLLRYFSTFQRAALLKGMIGYTLLRASRNLATESSVIL